MHLARHQLIGKNIIPNCCTEILIISLVSFHPLREGQLSSLTSPECNWCPWKPKYLMAVVRRAGTIRPYFYTILHKPTAFLLPDHFNSLCIYLYINYGSKIGVKYLTRVHWNLIHRCLENHWRHADESLYIKCINSYYFHNHLQGLFSHCLFYYTCILAALLIILSRCSLCLVPMCTRRHIFPCPLGAVLLLMHRITAMEVDV